MKAGAGQNTDVKVTVTNSYPTLSKLNVLYEVPDLGQHVDALQYRWPALERAVPSIIHKACLPAAYISSRTDILLHQSNHLKDVLLLLLLLLLCRHP
jgi:hypothetical protein